MLNKVLSSNVQRVYYDIELNDKQVIRQIYPVLPSGAVTKHYFDSKLALAVNKLIRKNYLNTASLSKLQTDMISRLTARSTAAASVNSNYDGQIAEMLGKIESNLSSLVSLRQETTELLHTSVSNLQTDMISRIEATRTAAASVHSTYDDKIAEMFGKTELNVSGLVILSRETGELLHTTRTVIYADSEQKMTSIRGRQQEIINHITSTQRSLKLLRTRHSELKRVVDANKIITDDLVVRANGTRVCEK